MKIMLKKIEAGETFLPALGRHNNVKVQSKAKGGRAMKSMRLYLERSEK